MEIGKKFFKLFVIIALSCIVQKSYANSDNPIISILDGSKNQIAKDSSVNAKDSLFFSTTFASNLVKPYPVKNVITFHINELSHVLLPSTFTAIVHLQVNYTNASNQKDSLNDLRLVINYNASSTYTSRASFIFSGAYQVKIKVLSDTISSSVISALMIDDEIIPSRIYTFACTGKDITQINLAGTTADELTVSWNNVVGADQADLEWTYIDSSALSSGLYSVNGNFDPNLIFINNSTRVSISDLSYAIPLIFPGTGSLFVRVRAVHFSDGTRIVSNWSSNYSPNGMLKYDYTGHEKKLNWQSSVSFAEDGKRKVVVQYYDGSLRNHETVTKDNSNNTTVTAETFYDYQGRPAIQVLPSPSINTTIQFTKNFNRINGAEYDKSYFDSVIYPKTVCTLQAPAMDSAYGAALYYSANNPQTTGIHKFIPESYGYAFTQTEYTQDNTGRISRQGGVGQEFQLNSGHETKYYYSITPDQNELDALFGTEAGDHTHYFKNAVRDANGQYSVSYVDMHGRTVATALAGTAPSSLTAIDSNIPSVITQTLADASTNITDGLSMIIHKSILITKAGNQHFQYSLNPQTFQLNNCNTSPICYDCMYNLTVTITDDCGNQKLGGHPLVFNKSNITVTDSLCNGNGIALDTSIFLDEGNYEITKTLSVDVTSQNNYRDDVYSTNNICKTTSDFINFQKQALPQGNCNLTCESCRASIGSYSNFKIEYMTKVYGDTSGTNAHQTEILAAYNNTLVSCDAYCNDTVTAQTDYVKKAMLLDMSPKSGQYANLDSAQDLYSIFYSSGGTSTPIYQQVSNYINDQGDLDSVWDNISDEKVPPQQLDAEQFAEDFKPSWADALFIYHPEYCKWQAYYDHYSAYTWDKKFLAVASYSEAVTLGYINPTASGTKQDPLMSDASSYNFGSKLSNKYTHFDTTTKNGITRIPSMWQIALLNTKCPTGDTACIQNIVFNSQDYTLACKGDSDQAWRNFQNLYSNYRTELLNDFYANYVSCSVTAAQLVNDNHYLNFNTSGSLLNANGLEFASSGNQQQIKDSAQTQMQKFYQSNCQSYDSLWAQQLSSGYQPSQINTLLPLLNQVCLAGSDQSHPFGSRNINPSSSLVSITINSQQRFVSSFDDIINNYNNIYSIQPTLTRNADVLTVPGPYLAPPVYNQIISTKPNTNQCNAITNYYNLYQSNKRTGETFSQYLKRTTNTDVSDSNLNTLRTSCLTGNPTCNYLSSPIILPPIFQDNAQNPCTDCYTFNSLQNQYLNKYGSSAYPQITNQTDTLQQRKNQLFTSFMNNQLGYNFTINDYLDFLNKCKGYGDSSNLINQYVQPISQLNGNCNFTQHQGNFFSVGGYPVYVNYFDSVTNNYPYNIPADLIYASQNNASSWTNTQNTWTISNGFTGHALQLSSAFPDTTTLMLNYSVDNNTLIDRLRDVVFYNSSSDSGYTNWSIYINDALNAQGVLNNDNGLLHPTHASLSPSQDYNGINNFVIKIKLFGGLHGHAATFKMDNFGLYGWKLNNYGFSYATGDKPETGLFFISIDTSNHSHPYTSFINQPYWFTGNAWINSYNNWLIYKAPNYALGNLLAITSATQDTATITATFQIAKGYKINLRDFSWRAWSSYDSGYTNYSVCVNGRFIGQDSLGKNYFGQFQYDGGRWWAIAPGTNPIPVYNTVENISNQLTITIKLFGGLHGSSSMFAFSHFNFGGFLYQINDSVPKICGKSQPAYPPTHLDTINSCTDSTFYAVSSGTEMYKNYFDSAKNFFDSLYHVRCLNAYKYETFTVTDTVDEYHYTLYYYDQAGNLVQTIPPKAVIPNWDSTYLSQVKIKRAAGDTLRPGHNLSFATQYRYNTLNQVVSQKTPDAGISNFYYDRLGRVVLSQNAKQVLSSKYSYTSYDLLGRIIEVGELTNASAMNTTVSKSPSQLQSWLNTANTSRTQIIQTTYDTVYFGIDGITLNAKNLRNRVSYTQYFPVAPDQTNAHPKAGTYYSYDIEGNVDTLLQDYTIPSLPSGSNRFFKKIVYQYDLISGKVNLVAYNPGSPDAIYHQYIYDAENRITNVETSVDSIYWEDDAFYKYYLHGPLARSGLGEQQIQGIDYAYTLQGWLKGINTTNANSNFDMGNDGFSSNRIDVARDAYGFALHYFATDYRAVTNNYAPFAAMNTTVLSSFKPLYNGNIAAMSENLTSFSKPLLFSYGYDQLNRLVQMRAYKNSSTGFSSSNNLWSPASVPDYSEDVSYDPNGNILKYKRYGNSTNGALSNALLMDSLNYKYIANSNKLDWIKDSVPSGSFTVDIDNQGQRNYRYDSIGNMFSDSTGGIDSISWNVYGKIQKINKHDGTTITYYYDAAQNRIGKVVTGATSGNGETWYVHDASNNVMSVYTVNDNTVNSGAMTLSEQSLYGSSRVGIYKPNLNLSTYSAPTLISMNGLGNVAYSNTFTRGKKLFELSNHLANVLVSISDKKIGVDGDNDGIINYYSADIVSANDYYPGGMQMQGRTYTASTTANYRYGFNGKEQDPETYGQGNEYDYGFRIYNPRIGRFLSVDPLTKKYPELTPYQFASNTPIAAIDLDGLEGKLPEVIGTTYAKITKLTDKQVADNIASLNVPGLSDSYLKALVKEEGLSLSMYDVDNAVEKLNTVKGRGGNATVGFGHLVHYGAIGSTQYDVDALTKESAYTNDITIADAFTLLSDDLTSRMTTLNNALDNKKVTNAPQGVVDLFMDLIYNTGSANNAMSIYKQGGVWGLSMALDNKNPKVGQVIKNVSDARKNMRQKLIEKDLQQENYKKSVDDPREINPSKDNNRVDVTLIKLSTGQYVLKIKKGEKCYIII